MTNTNLWAFDSEHRHLYNMVMFSSFYFHASCNMTFLCVKIYLYSALMWIELVCFNVLFYDDDDNDDLPNV